MPVFPRLRSVLFAATVLTAPAAAAIVEVAGVPATPGFNLFRAETALDAAVPLKAPPAVALKAGDMALVFEATSLVEIGNALGGDIQHAGDAGDSTYWLCYSQPGSATTPAALVWFQSGEMGGEEHTLQSVAVETAPAAVPPECVVPKKPLDLETGLPGLGAKLADVTTAFGPATPKDGLMAYAHEGKMGETTVWTYLGYRLDGDMVSAYQLVQMTGN